MRGVEGVMGTHHPSIQTRRFWNARHGDRSRAVMPLFPRPRAYNRAHLAVEAPR